MSALATLFSLVAVAAPAPVTLTVRYVSAADVEHVGHLRCRGTSAHADGFVRTAGARAACRHARAIAAFLAARSNSRRMCTQVYGGAQRAHITGAIGARHIDRRFKRTNGCEIADWQRAVPLVPRARASIMP